jgi:glyoxylase-like metal-dependent hydrolase (beta-lactamase superfamily II)
MLIRSIAPQSFASNCYLAVSGGHALVVDPAVSLSAILTSLGEEGATCEGIVLTHGHFDHILSLDALRDATGAPAYIHKEDAIMLTDGKKNAFYELFKRERSYRAAEKLLSNGDTILLGNEKLTVFHTPGHTHGSVCYLCDGMIFSGDTLFLETYGRCDLWNGDINKMHDSLRSMRNLAPSLTIYPGHGQSGRLGDALDNVFYHG